MIKDAYNTHSTDGPSYQGIDVDGLDSSSRAYYARDLRVQ